VFGAMLPGTLLTGVLVWRAFANNRADTERRLLDSARVDAAALDREFATIESTSRRSPLLRLCTVTICSASTKRPVAFNHRSLGVLDRPVVA
jgi:hypothetical protein